MKGYNTPGHALGMVRCAATSAASCGVSHLSIHPFFRLGMKKTILLLAGLLLVLSSVGAKEITILYSSSLNGNLDGCECKSAPKAGLVSSAVMLREVGDDALYFDLGDRLDVYPDPDLSAIIHSSYADLGLDLAVVGDQEFVEGVDWLLEQDFPFAAGNMNIDGEPVSPAFQLTDFQGVEVLVTAVVDPGTFFFASQEVKDRVELSDPAVFAESTLVAAGSAGDVKILLYHGSTDKAADIFTGQDGWDIVLAGHDQRLIEETLNRRRRFFGSPGENGNRLGILTIDVRFGQVREIKNQFRYFNYFEDPKDDVIVKSIDRYKRMMTERLSQ